MIINVEKLTHYHPPETRWQLMEGKRSTFGDYFLTHYPAAGAPPSDGSVNITSLRQI